MDKQQVIESLKETGLLLKAKGENTFKAKAYLVAAKTIQHSQENVELLIAENRLTELPGVGDSIRRYITELYKTGQSSYLNRLRAELPTGAAELSQVRGMTLKRMEILNRELNVSTLNDLRRVCEEGRLAEVKGFGIKVQNDMLQALSSSGSDEGQIRLIKAFELSDEIISALKDMLGTNKIEIAGAVRRWHETVDQISIVVQASKRRTLSAIKKIRGVISIEATEDGVIARLIDGIALYVYPVSNLAFGLVQRTGTAQHFADLEKQERKLKLEFAEETFKSTASERKIFEKIGLHYIPCELREGHGEVESSVDHDFAELVNYKDIRGMTHCHSNYSDGNSTIEQMARAAEKMGMEYITITDHSPTAHYAGGLTIDRLKEQWDEIDKVQESCKIKILKGTECDILADGKLDYPDHILERFDVIIASIHARYRQNEEAMTKRLLQALKNPFFKVWGHPLGRITLHRDPIPCDVTKILEAIADARVAIEINGDPYRMDLAPNWCEIARDLGLKFVISTDAHSRGDYRSLEYGIHMARRAKITKTEVLNTLECTKFRAVVNPSVRMQK